jgi:outer membrane protein assembly factor BamB
MRWNTRTMAMTAVLAMGLLAAACVPPSAAPPATPAQNPPFGVNGMFQEGPTVWVADLFGKQLVRFSPDTGVIIERSRIDDGLCSTDDVVVAPGGDLVATCPTEGRVIRVPRGGTPVVLATVGRGVNPIALEPSGDSVVVGFGTEDDNRLLRIPLDGGPVQVVATGLPVLNGFGFGPDGLLYVPTGGAAGILGTGGLGRIDVTTGAFTQLPLSFPGEPGRTGFDFACGVDVAADGTVFVGQCFNPSAYAVDPATGAARLVGRSPLGIADNVLALSDGRILLSGFFGGQLTVFTPDGGGYATHVLQVGG